MVRPRPIIMVGEQGELQSLSTPSKVLLLHSVVRGHHIFKDIWTPYIGENLKLRQEVGNKHDSLAVAVMRPPSTIVGRVPKELSKFLWTFLDSGGEIVCEVTGKRKKERVSKYHAYTSFLQLMLCGSSAKFRHFRKHLQHSHDNSYVRIG